MSAPRARLAGLPALIVVCVCLAPAGALRAGDQHPTVTHVDAALDEALGRALRLEREGRLREAAGEFIKARALVAERRRSSPEKRYVLRVSEDLDWGIERAIAARIERLPREALQAYLLAVEPRAKAVLTAARRGRDLDMLEALVKRYPLAPSGLQGLSLLGDWAFERGELSRAAAAWSERSRRLARMAEGSADAGSDAKPDKRRRAEASAELAKAATALALIKDEDGLTWLRSCHESWLAGVPLPPSLARAGSGSGPEVAPETPEATPALAEAAAVPFPARRSRRVEIAGAELDATLAESLREAGQALPRLYEPVVEPAARFGQTHMILADSKTVRRYRFGGEPRELWSFTVATPDSVPERLEALVFRPAIEGDRVFATLNQNRPARRVKKAPVPAKPAEGEPAPDPQDEEDKPKNNDPDAGFEFVQPPNWRIVALQRETGRLLWDVAAGDRFARFARSAEWISSPTVSGGAVYVTLTLRENALRSLVMRISAESGEIEWIADLASRSPENHRGLAAIGGAPVVLGGRVYVATGLGVIAALNAAAGELEWVYHYPVHPIRSQAMIVDEARRARPGPVAILRGAGVVVAAPADGPYIHGLRLATGEPVWQTSRRGARDVVIDGGDVLLVGDRVTAISGDSGVLLREGPELPSAPVARPLRTADGLLVSTDDAILRLDRATLAPVARFEAEAGGAGALAKLDKTRLVSVSARHFEIYWSAARTKRTFDRPGGAERGVELGHMALARGDHEGAIRAFELALGSSAASADPVLQVRLLEGLARARIATARTHLKAMDGAAGDDAVAADRHLATAAASTLKLVEVMTRLRVKVGRMRNPRRAELEAQLVTLQRDVADRLAQSPDEGRRRLAITLLQNLLDRPADLEIDGENGVRISARQDAERRQRRLIEKSGRAIYKDQEELAASLAKTARSRGTRAAMLAVIRRFPVSRAAVDLRFELARFYRKQQLHVLGSEALEEFLATAPQDERVPEALAMLADMLHRRGRDREAAEVLARLVEKHGDAAVRDTEDRPISVARFAAALRARLRVLSEPEAANRALCLRDVHEPIKMLFRTESDLDGSSTSALDVGPFVPADQLFLMRGSTIESRLVDGGLVQWRRHGLDPITPERPARLLPGRLLIPSRHRLLALDPLSGRTLWEFAPIPSADPADPVTSLTAFATDGQAAYVLDRNRVLHALDLDGKTLWKHREAGRVSGAVLAREGRVVLPIQEPAALVVMDAGSGKETARIVLSRDLRSTWLARPALVPGRAVAALSGRRLVGVDLEKSVVTYRRTLMDLGEITGLEISTDESSALVLGRQQLADRASLVCVDIARGRLNWSDDGRGLVGGRLRRGSKAKIDVIQPGDGVVYTVRRRSLQVNEVWCQDLATGRRRWIWDAPRGQGPKALIETPGLLLVPYGGRLTGCSLSVLARGAGKTLDTLKFPGRRIVDARTVAGAVVVLSDHGQFAFGHLDSRQVEAELVEMLELMQTNRAAHPVLRALLADRLQKLGRLDSAVGLLTDGILAEGLEREDYDRLSAKLAAVLEQRIEDRRPALRIRKLTRPADIDGELSDWWRSSSAVELRGPVHVRTIQPEPGADPGVWKGQEDLSATIYMAWDERNFYFAIDVCDTDLRPYDSEADTWIGDCLLMAIDPMNNGGLWYSRDDLLLSLALTRPRKKKDEDKKNQQGQDKKDEDRKRPDGKYFVKRKEDNSGAVYECKVPWSMFQEKGREIDLSKGPPRGFEFGFNIVLTDDDGERGRDGKPRGALKALTWTPGVRLHSRKSRLWQGFFPEYFGKVRLD